MLLVRHGESEWNAIGRWQGQADPALSAEGERQARAAGEAVRSLGIDIVVTSNLERARRTGALLAEAADLPLADPVADLAERSAGAWEGLTRAEIEVRYPGFLADGRRPPGYEPDESILDRGRRGLQSIRHLVGDRTALVVSHGGVIGTLERVVGHAWRRFDNLEGRWFDIGHDVLRPVGERLLLVAEADAHPVSSVDRDAI